MHRVFGNGAAAMQRDPAATVRAGADLAASGGVNSSTVCRLSARRHWTASPEEKPAVPRVCPSRGCFVSAVDQGVAGGFAPAWSPAVVVETRGANGWTLRVFRTVRVL